MSKKSQKVNFTDWYNSLANLEGNIKPNRVKAEEYFNQDLSIDEANEKFAESAKEAGSAGVNAGNTPRNTAKTGTVSGAMHTTDKPGDGAGAESSSSGRPGTAGDNSGTGGGDQ